MTRDTGIALAGAALVGVALVTSRRGGAPAGTVREHFLGYRDDAGRLFGWYSTGVPKTPIPWAHAAVIVEMVDETQRAIQRSSLNTEDRQAAFDDARARYHDAIEPLFRPWSDANGTDDGGVGDYSLAANDAWRLDAVDSSIFWTETIRYAEELDRDVWNVKTAAEERWNSIKDIPAGIGKGIGAAASGITGGIIGGTINGLLANPIGLLGLAALGWVVVKKLGG